MVGALKLPALKHSLGGDVSVFLYQTGLPRFYDPTAIMKFTAGIIAVLASCAAAVTTPGEAFTFPRDGSSSTASLGRSLARLVLLQRLAGAGEGPTIRDIPESIKAEDAVAILNKYAPFREALFSTAPATVPKRLLVMIDGMTTEQIKDAREALGQDATFMIDDLPRSAANRDFLEIDAYNAGATNLHSCSLGEIVQMTDRECWGKESTAARYSVSKVCYTVGGKWKNWS